MASSHVAGGEENNKQPVMSPGNLRRTWSSNSSASHLDTGSPPKCVCAPATHAGSFKCRLHRVNSHGHSSAPLPQQQPVSNSSSRTVEAL